MKTHDLQKVPVDLHIHPECEHDICRAEGRLLNDDGVVLDYVGHQNRYNFLFSMKVNNAIPYDITLEITQTHEAAEGTINNNDVIGSLIIYDANRNRYKLYHDYKVEFFNKAQKLIHTDKSTYDSYSMRLIYKGQD